MNAESMESSITFRISKSYLKKLEMAVKDGFGKTRCEVFRNLIDLNLGDGSSGNKSKLIIYKDFEQNPELYLAWIFFRLNLLVSSKEHRMEYAGALSLLAKELAKRTGLDQLTGLDQNTIVNLLKKKNPWMDDQMANERASQLESFVQLMNFEELRDSIFKVISQYGDFTIKPGISLEQASQQERQQKVDLKSIVEVLTSQWRESLRSDNNPKKAAEQLVSILSFVCAWDIDSQPIRGLADAFNLAKQCDYDSDLYSKQEWQAREAFNDWSLIIPELSDNNLRRDVLEETFALIKLNITNNCVRFFRSAINELERHINNMEYRGESPYDIAEMLFTLIYFGLAWNWSMTTSLQRIGDAEELDKLSKALDEFAESIPALAKNEGLKTHVKAEFMELCEPYFEKAEE